MDAAIVLALLVTSAVSSGCTYALTRQSYKLTFTDAKARFTVAVTAPSRKEAMALVNDVIKRYCEVTP